MSSRESAHAIALRYHDAWSSRRVADAVELLDDALAVEVPVNHYPTRASFAAALASFGSMVEQVELLSHLGGPDEAMLLYDMQVRGVGTLRVAEHFAVSEGRIVRIRQVHDTAPIRAVGLGA